MHIYAHGSIFIEFHVQMCKYVQMCMCNVMCTHAHRMFPAHAMNLSMPRACHAQKLHFFNGSVF